MANNTARLGLLALLVLAAAAHVSGNITEALATVDGVKGALALAAAKGGTAARSDISDCWGPSRTCRITAGCTSSKCQCCGCVCATLDCVFNTLKAAYVTVAKAIAQVKTPADKRAVAPTICKLAKTSAPVTKQFVSLYKQVKCPGYTAKVKALTTYQAKYNQWCKAFSG